MPTPSPQQCAAIPDDDTALAHALQYDAGLEAARAGVQDLHASFSDLPFTGCPETWTELPFARIVWREERGDRHVGIQDMSGWCLAEDQAGTVVATLAAQESDGINASGTPTPTVQELMDDPAGSTWVKTALETAMKRDPVDAANDAEVLARVLAVHADAVLASARAQLRGGGVAP